MRVFSKLILLFVFLAFSIQMPLMAQTFHYIGFYDTEDESIGENKIAERRIVANQIELISDAIADYGYNTSVLVYDGEDCNKDVLMDVLQDLSVGPKDVVFFYYGGHGGRSTTEKDPFPQMCLGSNIESEFVPASLVKNIIAKKNPLFSLVVSACCNSESSAISVKSYSAEGNYTKESEINKESIKKMFLDQKGIVQFTSSRAGQYSYSSKQGGVFCILFWELMKEVEQGKREPEWKSFCQSVTNEVSQVQINFRGEIVHQNPYFEIYGSTIPNPNVNPNRNTNTVTYINNQVSTLHQDLERLLDKSVSTDFRLNMISTVASRHFTPGAKVFTVGTDMKTLVDVEDPIVFLRRIVLSNFISEIHIVGGCDGGLSSKLYVHEVRTR